MSSDIYEGDLSRQDEVVAKLEILLESLRTMKDKFEENQGFYNGWNGPDGQPDDFKRKTQDPYDKANEEWLGIVDSFQAVVEGLQTAVGTTFDSMKETREHADDLINDAKQKSDSLNSPDGGDGSGRR